MATYTTQNANKVERLVLYAPQWIRQTPSLVQVSGKLGAYRTVNRDQSKERWFTGVPEDKKAALVPAGWFDAWADATFATDPVGAQMSPPVLRAPNGVVQDGLDFWAAGKSYYDPSEDHGADAADPRRVGQGHAALHGADAVPAAGELARQALRRARRKAPTASSWKRTA